MTRVRQTPRVPLCTCLLLLISVTGPHAQRGAANGEWPTYGGDLGHTRYAPLDQINAPPTSARSRSRGASRPTTSGPRRSFNSSPRR